MSCEALIDVLFANVLICDISCSDMDGFWVYVHRPVLTVLKNTSIDDKIVV